MYSQLLRRKSNMDSLQSLAGPISYRYVRLVAVIPGKFVIMCQVERHLCFGQYDYCSLDWTAAGNTTCSIAPYTLAVKPSDFYSVTSYLTEKLSKLRSFDRK